MLLKHRGKEIKGNRILVCWWKLY